MFRGSSRSDRFSDKFEKFTERARLALRLAQEEAQQLNHNYIGTEHLLLGLVREGEGVAARALQNLGVELPRVRQAVMHIIGVGDRIVLDEVGMTPRAKKVLELAVDESRRLNHHYIGTEHLLLGLIREGEGIATGVLESLGVTLERARTEVVRIIGQGTAEKAHHRNTRAQEQRRDLPPRRCRRERAGCAGGGGHPLDPQRRRRLAHRRGHRGAPRTLRPGEYHRQRDSQAAAGGAGYRSPDGWWRG